MRLPWPPRRGPAAAGASPRPRRAAATSSAAEAAEDVALGALLRITRQQRGMTLAEIARDTRINLDYLEALEEERYDVLPAPVYTRGFLRSYARQLRLDEEAVLSLLPRELPRPPGLEPIAGLRRAPGAALPAFRLPAALPRSTPLILAVAAVLVLLLLLFAALRGGGGGDGGVDLRPATPVSRALPRAPHPGAAALLSFAGPIARPSVERGSPGGVAAGAAGTQDVDAGEPRRAA